MVTMQSVTVPCGAKALTAAPNHEKVQKSPDPHDLRGIMTAKHNFLPEIIVHSLEPSLFLRQRTSAKDRLKIDPLPLDLVQIVEVVIEFTQACLPDRRFVLEGFVVGRVFEGVEQALVVADLRERKMVGVRETNPTY